MKEQIPIAYTSPGGERVYIPVDHTLISGRTQQSGKTTTAEAMAHQVDAPVLAFVTKRDEHGFRDVATVPPLYFGRVDWEFVVSILKAGLDHPDIDDGWIIRLCQADQFKKAKWPKPKTLADVLANCETALGSSGATALHKLRTYLQKVVPSVASLTPTTKLPRLVNGINMMDLRAYPLAVQFIIMGNTLEYVYEHARGMIVLIPEAQKFFPLKANTPLKGIGEKIINERAAAPIFLWLDSQMLRNLDTAMRGQIGVWLFGVQQEVNEAKRTLEHCPDHLPRPTLGQLMQLKRGFFVAAFRQTLIPKMYVQPFFMGDAHAQAIAMGEAPVESAEKIWREKRRQVERGANVGHSTGSPRSKSVVDVDAPHGNPGLPAADDGGRSQSLDDVSRGSGHDSPAEAEAAEGESEVAHENPTEEGADPVAPQPTTHNLQPDSDEETMYKEKFEALCVIVEALISQGMPGHHSEKLKAEIARLRGSVVAESGQAPAPSSAGPGARAGEAMAKGSSPTQAQPRPTFDGALSEQLWQAIKARAAADPGVLELLASRPELRVKVEKAVIPAEGVLVPLAKLLHDGFFSVGRKSKAVEGEFNRRAYPESRITIYNGLQKLCQLGFLVKEEVGKREYEFHAVPGMKVTVRE